MCFKKISKESVKGVLRMFQRSFVLQFCCCMKLIAATRAEGGLVFLLAYGWGFKIWPENLFQVLTNLDYSLNGE